MTAAAAMWERVYRAALRARRQVPTASRRRYEQRRAAGLCGACGAQAVTAACEGCKTKARDAYRARVTEREGRRVKPHRRKAVQP